MTPLEFFEQLYPQKPDNLYLLLWQNKKSHWFQDIGQAADHVTRHPDDCYYGVGLSPRDFGPNKRCKAEDIACIPGLWADIDIGPGKNGKNYPPSIDDALKLINDNLPAATMIVSSGHGLHVYWLFKELLKFDSDQQRQDAHNMNRRLSLFLIECARKKGWTLDNCSDLARILRPVGSLNCKHNPSKNVSVISNGNLPYQDLSNFDEFVPPVSIPEPPKTLDVYSHAQPPPDLLELLKTNIPEAKLLWEKNVKHGNDKSQSGLDFTLAEYAIKAGGWTDQEITNLLISYRKKNDKDIKRPDYYVRTILNARNAASGTGDEISEHLRTEVIEITRFEAEPTYYRFKTKDHGIVEITSTKNLLNQTCFQATWAEQTKIVIPKLPQKKWEEKVQTILKSSVDSVADPEARSDTRVVLWLREYLGQYKPEEFEEWEKRFHDNDIVMQPGVLHDHWIISPTMFFQWALRTKNYGDTIYKLRKSMRDVGCTHKAFKVRKKDDKGKLKRHHVNYKMIPHEVADPNVDLED